MRALVTTLIIAIFSNCGATTPPPATSADAKVAPDLAAENPNCGHAGQPCCFAPRACNDGQGSCLYDNENRSRCIVTDATTAGSQGTPCIYDGDAGMKPDIDQGFCLENLNCYPQHPDGTGTPTCD